MAIRDFITSLHIDYCQSISENLDWLSGCFYYSLDEAEIVTPEAHFSVSEWKMSEKQNGTGELFVDLTCDVTLIFDSSNVSSQIDIRNAAMDVCYLIHGNTLSTATAPAQVIEVKPDIERSDLTNYLVWKVSFLQRIAVGDCIWEETGVIPTQVYLSQSPNIGVSFEENYQLLEEL